MPDVFDALAAPARRTIMDALAHRDEQTLFELLNRLRADHSLALTRQAVSQHLDVLEQAAVVERRREGRYTFLTLTPGPLQDIPLRWPDRSTS